MGDDFLYDINENGELFITDSLEDVNQDFQELFPDAGVESDLDVNSDSVSSGDSGIAYVPYSGPSASDIASEIDIITYDELIEALAAIPGYNSYPSTAAISVFDSVFVGNSNIHYLCLADSTGTSMYYSDDFEISGATITLKAPVTHLEYYSIRVNNVTNYYYTVSSEGDVSFTPTTQLVYTDLLTDYPSLPSDTRGVPGSSIFGPYRGIIWTLSISFAIVSFLVSTHRIRSSKNV